MSTTPSYGRLSNEDKICVFCTVGWLKLLKCISWLYLLIPTTQCFKWIEQLKMLIKINNSIITSSSVEWAVLHNFVLRFVFSHEKKISCESHAIYFAFSVLSFFLFTVSCLSYYLLVKGREIIIKRITWKIFRNHVFRVSGIF